MSREGGSPGEALPACGYTGLTRDLASPLASEWAVSFVGLAVSGETRRIAE